MGSNQQDFDAVVVGGGPNGLSAAIELSRAGLSVCLFEKSDRLGGGVRSEELTLPGVQHDICSSIYPLGFLSPFFNSLPLSDIKWSFSPVPLAHPFENGAAACLFKSGEETSRQFGKDSGAYQKMMDPFVERAEELFRNILAPIRFPENPVLLSRFGRVAFQSALRLAAKFSNPELRAVLAGCSAHSILPLSYTGSAAIGLALIIAAHFVGWPLPIGGSQQITNALENIFLENGGLIELNQEIQSLSQLPTTRAILLDLTPRQIASIAGNELKESYKRRLMNYKYGPGVFKIDWALKKPIPWMAKECELAATMHLGNSLEEIADAEAVVWKGGHPQKPFVILAQPSLFDPTRAPAGIHTAWAYCHVPNGSTLDMTLAIEAQVERFAPGFQEVIMARHVLNCEQLEQHNPNLVGGDISGGANTISQILLRPVFRFDPYSTPNNKIFICSSSTPPGAGVHGMCGYYAARSVLNKCFDR